MADAHLILCKDDPGHASLTCRLCATLHREHLLGLEWLASWGVRGHSTKLPSAPNKDKETNHGGLCHQQCQGQTPHGVCHAGEVKCNIIVELAENKEKQTSIYNVTIHRNLGLGKFLWCYQNTEAPLNLQCPHHLHGGGANGLRELAAFELGCQKDSSLIERCVSSFYSFAVYSFLNFLKCL